MNRNLGDLTTDAYPYMCQWIARCVARDLAVMIIQVLRTPAEHAANLATGRSGTNLSLHLPRSLRAPTLVGFGVNILDNEKSDAMDLAPYKLYQQYGDDKLNWDATDPAWKIIGEEAEKVCDVSGTPMLRWGGRWRQPFDPGHCEFVLPSKRTYLLAERGRPFPTFRA